MNSTNKDGLGHKEDIIFIGCFSGSYGAKKLLDIRKWYLIDAPVKSRDGKEWLRVIMSPNGWIYRDYYSGVGTYTHDLQLIYFPEKTKHKKSDDDNRRYQKMQ